MLCGSVYLIVSIVFFQAEDGIRYLVRSRGLGDVYKRQISYKYSGDRAMARVSRWVAI